jgi:putative glutamine amidotransferase
MKKPIIGISGNLEFAADYLFKGYPRIMINEDYPRSIIQAGGVPFIMSPTREEDVITQMIESVDAILLSGGQDVDPLIYGEQPTTKMGATSPLRDHFERKIIDKAIELKKPVFGICRGTQIINAHFGGTINQDNSMQEGSFIKHMHESNPAVLCHNVKLEKDSFMYEIAGTDEILINSFHHQSINKVAPGFKSIGQAPDGIIEGIQKIEPGVLIAAVQWHPEMLSREDKVSQKFFEYIVTNSIEGVK